MALVPIVVLAAQSNAAIAGVDNRLFELLAADGGAFELVKVAEGGTSLYPDPSANGRLDGDTTIKAAIADRITDFAAGDRIDLSNMQADGPEAFAFIDQATFSGDGTGGELRYRHAQGNTYVEGDVDANGLVDFTIRLDDIVILTSSDFLL